MVCLKVMINTPMVVHHGLKMVYMKPDDSWFRARRNLNFETHLVEFQAVAELNLKNTTIRQESGPRKDGLPLHCWWFRIFLV